MESNIREYVLEKPSTTQEWDNYHSIRKTELFPDSDYDCDHIDDKAPNNHPLLLKHKGNAIATVRIDLRKQKAIIRLLAVKNDEQNKGHGRYFYLLIEDYLRKHQVMKIMVNAAPEAIGYYQKMGFETETWDAEELKGIAEDCIQMTKTI